MNFEKAFKKVRKGKKGMRLPFWKSDVAVFCQIPDEMSKMTAPYLYVESRFGRVPWKETYIELFSPDWETVDPDQDIWDDDDDMDGDWTEAPTTFVEPIEIEVSPRC